MEMRKVQLSGGTTYTVSLPKPWAQEHGIDSDSLLVLHPNDDASLLVEVAGESDRSERTITVDVGTTGPKALEQQIVALYAVGFDTIRLRDRTGIADDLRKTVEQTITRLSGFELLEATDTQIRLKSLIDAENVDIRKSALRLRLVALSMHADAITAIADNDADLARDVVRRDSEADKLFAMVPRHFRRSLSSLQEVEKLDHSRDELFEYYHVCRQLERVADHAEKMATFVLDEEQTIPEALISHLEAFGDTAFHILDDAADVVLTDGDVGMAHESLARRDELCSEIDAVDRELYDHGEPEAAYTTGLLLDSIKRTANYGANIAEVGIQQVIRENSE
jgi:phosphate uptake regulator